MAHGLVRGNDQEYFLYATEGYGDDGPRLRRFSYRVDGFVSVRAGLRGGAVVTPPFTFEGRQLVVNYIAYRRGGVRVELQDADSAPLDGLALDDCEELSGDAIERVVVWKTGADPGRHAGRAVRLRFALRHADLFSFRFQE
jgi:hypothetical protein